MEAGRTVGDCCPKGRKAEDGTITEKYTVIELESAEFYCRLGSRRGRAGGAGLEKPVFELVKSYIPRPDPLPYCMKSDISRPDPSG